MGFLKKVNKLIVLTLVLTGLSLAQAEQPHPQLTYGAIKFMGDDGRHKPSCAHRWSKDAEGGVIFKPCPNGPSLFEELGRLDEDDPHYEDKKTILVELIDSAKTPDT